MCVSATCSEKTAATEDLPPPGLCELASVCVSAACSKKQRLLRVCHRHGSMSWRVCVSAPRVRRSSGCSGFATARALGAGGCVCQRRVLQKAAVAQGLPPPGLRSWRVCVSAVCSKKNSSCSGFATARALGAGGCVCKRRVLQKAAVAQGLPPPGLWELAGVCVSAACSEKQRLLKVCQRQGSGSWRVCVCQRRLVYVGVSLVCLECLECLECRLL